MAIVNHVRRMPELADTRSGMLRVAFPAAPRALLSLDFSA